MSLPVRLRPFIKTLLFVFALLLPAVAQAQYAITLSSAQSGSIVPAGTTVVLKAVPTINGNPAALGDVQFYSIVNGVPELIGDQQANRSGAPVFFTLKPSAGPHQYFALWNRNGTDVVSIIVAAANTPTSVLTSTTTGAGAYNLGVTLSSTASAIPPGGLVTFTDQTASKTLATQSLTPSTGSITHGAITKAAISAIYNESAMTYGDFNNDGLQDIIVGGSNSATLGQGAVVIFFSNGDGTYTSSTQLMVSSWIVSRIVVGDFNGDGLLDFVITESRNTDQAQDGSFIYVFIQNTPSDSSAKVRTFTNVANFPTHYVTKDMVVADVNHDGYPDIITGNAVTNDITVIFGQKDSPYFQDNTGFPTFQTKIQNYYVNTRSGTGGATISGIAAADFNGDGNIDIAVADSAGNCVYMMLGDGHGGFNQSSYNLGGQTLYDAWQVGENPIRILPTQFPGATSLVVLNATGRSISVLHGTNSPSFFSSISSYSVVPLSAAPNLTDLALADLDQDGNYDAIVTDENNGKAYVLMGGAGNTFGSPITIDGGNRSRPVTAADVNGDGFPDILTATNIANGSLNTSLTSQTISSTASASIKLVGNTNHSIVASSATDGVAPAATSNALSLAAAQFSTASVLTSSKTDGLIGGDSITLTAAFTPVSTLGYTATGTFNFLDNGSAIGGCSSRAINGSGAATCAITSISATAHTYTAVYSGDTNFATSTGALALTPKSVAVTLALSANPNTGLVPSNTTTLTATIAPVTSGGHTATGSITFLDSYGGAPYQIICSAVAFNASGVATCATPQLGALSNSYVATYTGDVTFASQTSAIVALQGVGYATTTALSSSQSSGIAAGGTTTLTAHVSPITGGAYTATGSVNFTDNGYPVCSGVSFDGGGDAVCTTSALYPGAHSFVATYSGDIDFVGSTSSPLAATVLAGTVSATTTTLTPSATSLADGAEIVLTAKTVTTSGNVTAGYVNFCTVAANCAGKNLLASAQIVSAAGSTQGTATARFHLSAGIYNIQAVFTGTISPAITVSPSTSTAQIITVSGGGTTTTLSGSGANYTAITTASDSKLMTGTVSLQDTTNGNGVLASKAISPVITSAPNINQVTTNSLIGTPVFGDLNGDGKIDMVSVGQLDTPSRPTCLLVYTNLSGSHIFTGGTYDNGQFNTPDCYQLSNPSNPVIADVNGDGYPDIVVDGTQVFLNNGGGGFTQQGNDTGPGSGTKIVTGDFNGDGKADFAWASGGNLFLELGNGDGTFQSVVTRYVGGSPDAATRLVTGDFNGDGRTDIAFLGGGIVYVAMTDAANPGQFVVTHFSASNGIEIRSGDMNNDGKTDLVVSYTPDSFATFRFYTFLSNGDGTFTQSSTVTTPSTYLSFPVISYLPYNFELTDLDGDGNLDIASTEWLHVTQYTFVIVTVYGKGDGTYSGITQYDPNLQNETVSASAQYEIAGAADVTGNGHTALIGHTTNTDAAASGQGVTTIQFKQSATTSFTGVSVPGTGSHSVAAAYSGDVLYGASTSSVVTITGAGKTTTATTLSSTAPTHSLEGEAVTLTATISPSIAASAIAATGTVTFTDGVTTLGTGTVVNGIASYTISSLAAGAHSFSAAYSGDAAFLASSSSSITVYALGSTSTAFSVNYGSTSYIFTANVADSGNNPVMHGTVFFCAGIGGSCNGSGLLGSAQIDGTGTATVYFPFRPGSRNVQAVFQPTNIYNGSRSQAQPVNYTANTSTALNVSGSVGDYTLQAVVSAPLAIPPTGKVYLGDQNIGGRVLYGGDLTDPVSAKSYSSASTITPSNALNHPTVVATGDFNNDGFADMAVASAAGITILLGDGNGNFNEAPFSPHATNATALVVGDFNNDGVLDIAALSGTDVIIYGGYGDGNFDIYGTVSLSSAAHAFAVGDYNGDGNLDLAVLIGTSTLKILSGAGDFTFSTGSDIAVGSTAVSIASADLNGDGYTDLAIATTSTNKVYVLLGAGNGTFSAAAGSPITLTGSTTPSSIAIGDLDGDDALDLVVTDAVGKDFVLLGNGNGTFTAAANSPFTLGSAADRTAIGDVDGDGNPDMVATNPSTGKVAILLGDGSGGFTASPLSPLTAGASPHAATLLDVNGDGQLDVLTVNSTDNTLSLFTNTSTSTASITIADVPIPGTAGTAEIIANYQGDANYSGSGTSPAFLQESETATTTTLAISPSTTITQGQILTLTAALAPFTYNVTGVAAYQYGGSTSFLLDGSSTVACNIGSTYDSTTGITTCQTTAIPAGTHTITASSTDDGVFLASSSAPQSVTVNGLTGSSLVFVTKPSATLYTGETGGLVTLHILDSSNNQLFTDSTTFTLTVSSSNGYSKVYSSTLAVGTGQLVFDLSADPFSVLGTYTLIVTGGSYAPVAITSTVYPPQDFGKITLGSSATQLVHLRFSAGGTLGSIQTVTQGIQNLDYTLSANSGGNACNTGTTYAAEATCTVMVSFAPEGVGTRSGAVVLYNNASTPVAIGTLFLGGTGSGGSIAFAPTPVALNLASGYASNGGVAVDLAGNLYYFSLNADGNAYNLLKRTSAGVVSTVSTTFAAPTSLAIDGAGNLYYVDSSDEGATSDVFEIAAGTSVHQALETGVLSQEIIPTAVAVDSVGGVYVGYVNYDSFGGGAGIDNFISYTDYPDTFALRLDHNGNGAATYGFSASGFTTSSILASNGSLYVGGYDQGGNGSVYKFGSTTNPASYSRLTTPGLVTPVGLVLNAAGNLFIADAGPVASDCCEGGAHFDDFAPLVNGTTPGSLMQLSVDGTTASTSTTGVSYPAAVAINSVGNLYIANATDVTVLNAQVAPSLDLGTAAIGANSTATFAVTNTGNSPLYYTAAGSAPYTESDSCGGALAAGHACTMTVIFAPLSGSASPGTTVPGTLTLTANAPSSPLTLTLTGKAVAAATQLGFSSSFAPSITAGSSAGTVQVQVQYSNGAVVATATPTVTLTVTGPNSYSAAYTQAAVAGVADFTSQLSSVTLAGGSTPYVYTATASGLTAAAASQSVITAPSAASATVFATTNVGASSAELTINLAFSSSATVAKIQTMTLGSEDLDFTHTVYGSCFVGESVSSGSTCTLKVTFHPARGGLRAGAIVISDASRNMLVNYPISGTGVAPLALYSSGTVTQIGSGYPAVLGRVFDAAGNLYVANPFSSFGQPKVNKYDAVTNAQSDALHGAAVTLPYGIAIDGAGNIYMADNTTSYLPKYNPGTGLVTHFGTGLSGAQSVALDTAGNVYVSDNGNSRVVKFTPDGSSSTVINTGKVGYIALDPLGNLYACDVNNSRLLRVDAVSGAITEFATHLYPASVSIDVFGNIYVLDPNAWDGFYHLLYRYDAVTGARTSIQLKGLGSDNTVGVAISDRGVLGVFSSNNVYKIDNSGASIAFTGNTTIGATSTAQDITLSNGGNAALSISGLSAPVSFNYNGPHTTCNATVALASGGSCVIGVQFAPVASGSITGTGTVSTNAGTGSLSLSGTAITANSTTTLSASNTAPSINQSITLTASVVPAGNGSQPTGTVTFNDGSTALCTAVALNGGLAMCATPPLVAASHSFTAVYSGDTTFNTSTSSALAITVSALSQSIHFPTPSATAVLTDTITLAATATPSGLPIVYSVSGPGSITGSTLTFTGAGTVVVTASQPGNAYYAAATPKSRTITVSGPPPPIVIPGTQQQGTTSTPITATVTFTASAMLGSISAATLGAPGNNFVVITGSGAGTCVAGTTYSPGDSCTVNVTFTPTGPGLVLGILKLMDDGATPSVMATINLASLRYR